MSQEKNTLQKDIQRRKRRRKLAVNALAIGGAIALFSLLGFVHHSQKNTICRKLEIEIEESNGQSYLDEKMIASMANQATDAIVGKEINAINIAAIHKKISENSTVKEAHVYTSVDGRCIIHVKQRTPIARIFNQNGSSFYLDKEGYTMALSDLYTARVPVFVGNINEHMQDTSLLARSGDSDFNKRSLLDEIFQFTIHLQGNEFWKAQVEHVQINDDREFIIIPRVGNHRINMGAAANLEEKFKKLMAFYANTIHTRDLNQYSSIHVEYDGQIVCVKR
jgi:cell division protein FtsQ